MVVVRSEEGKLITNCKMTTHGIEQGRQRAITVLEILFAWAEGKQPSQLNVANTLQRLEEALSELLRAKENCKVLERNIKALKVQLLGEK